MYRCEVKEVAVLNGVVSSFVDLQLFIQAARAAVRVPSFDGMYFILHFCVLTPFEYTEGQFTFKRDSFESFAFELSSFCNVERVFTADCEGVGLALVAVKEVC